MHDTQKRKNIMQHYLRNRMGLLLLFLIVIVIPLTAGAVTLETRYPGLATSLLKSAALAPLDEETLLEAEGVTIKRLQLMEGIDNQEPELRVQLQKNLVFVLEQKAIGQILVNEARKAGIDAREGSENQAIQTLFEHHTKEISVSEDETHAFYDANKEMVGGAPYEQVVDGVRQYLIKEKRQRAITNYIDGLGEKVRLRLNDKWVEQQSRLATDNPVDQARRSGKPTMVEFGSTGCVPCDMMQPILDNLRKKYPDTLNVVFVHVNKEQVMAARYGIQSIPVQAFFDVTGKEVFRHVGFFAETEVNKQLAKMGVIK